MQAGAFFPGAQQYSVREIHADYIRPISAVKHNGQGSCSTTEIKHAGLPVKKDRPKTLCSARAPEAIELQGKKMVQEIVSRGDLREHFADFSRGVGFRDGAFGAGSLDRSAYFSHDALPNGFHLPRSTVCENEEAPRRQEKERVGGTPSAHAG